MTSSLVDKLVINTRRKTHRQTQATTISGGQIWHREINRMNNAINVIVRMWHFAVQTTFKTKLILIQTWCMRILRSMSLVTNSNSCCWKSLSEIIHSRVNTGINHSVATIACAINSVLPHYYYYYYPDSKVHGANVGPTWVLSAPDWPHVGHIYLALRVRTERIIVLIISCLPAQASYQYVKNRWTHRVQLPSQSFLLKMQYKNT